MRPKGCSRPHRSNVKCCPTCGTDRDWRIMAADFYIHVRTENITERDFEIFFGHTIGSHYGPSIVDGNFLINEFSDEEQDAVYYKFAESPSVWIGEVSWLKASLLDDSEKYVPDPVQAIKNIIQEYPRPILTEELRDKIIDSLSIKNTSGYKLATNIIEIINFLNSHLGKEIFTISW